MAVNPNFDHDAYAKKYLIKAHFTDTLGALLGATKSCQFARACGQL